VRERSFNIHTTVQRCDVVVFENRQPVTVAKFINKSSLFILLPGVTRLLELKPDNEQKVEHIFIAPPYYQTACCRLLSFNLMLKFSIRNMKEAISNFH
jgi:hypothetical protein